MARKTDEDQDEKQPGDVGASIPPHRKPDSRAAAKLPPAPTAEPESEAPPPPPPPPTRAEQAQGYRVGQWSDLDQYQCLACPYETLEKLQMDQHIARKHPRPRRARPKATK